MGLPRLLKDLANIAKLPDMPNRKNGGSLDADEFKAEFDRAALDIQDYINEELLPQIESDIDAAALGIGGSGRIDGSKLADGSVPGSKLADKTIVGSKLADNGVQSGNLADDAVESRHLADGAVKSAAIGDAAVLARHIAAGAVGSWQLGTAAVTNEKIGPEAVDERTLAAGAVTGDKIAAGAVSNVYTGTLLASGWVDNKQTLSMAGLPGDKPFILDMDTAGIESLDKLAELRDEWCPMKAKSERGTLTVVFADSPRVDIPIKVLVINK